jgi:O-antigen/teichoic acid export membrane protein
MIEDLRRKVLSGLLWSAVQNWGSKIVSLFLFAVLARLLDPHEFGLFASAMAVLGFVTIFIDQGLTEAIVQRPSVTPALLNTAFVINFALAVLIFAMLWLASPVIAKYMRLDELSSVLRAASLTILFTALGFSQGAMQRRNFQYRWIAICAFSSTLVSGGIGTVLAFAGHGAWSLVAQMVIGAAANTALLWLRAQWTLSFEFDIQGVRSLFSYGINRLGAHVLYFGYTRCIELFLAMSLGASALGTYLVGVKIYQSLMYALSGVILDVAHSGFSRIASEGRVIVSAYYKAMTITSAIAVPVFVLLACVAPEVTLVCFGEKWRQSADIMRPMALLGAVEVLEFYNGTVFNAIGKPSMGLILLLFKTPITFVAIWLARDQSLAAIVWWYVLVQLVTILPSFILTRKLVGISLYALASHIYPFLVGCLIASAVILALRTGTSLDDWRPVYRLLLFSGVGTLTYLGFVRLAARDLFSEMITTLKGRWPQRAS